MEANSVRSACHGTALITCVAGIRSPRTSTAVTPLSSAMTLASAPVRTSPPWLSINTRAGSAYIS